MKTIEFRVWNPTTKKMVYNANDINLNNGVVSEVINGKLTVHYLLENGEWKQTDLELFTGFLDSDGNKIYFGDKVKFFDDDEETVYEVKYHEKHKVPVLVAANDSKDVIFLFTCHIVIEIIGNIHEEEAADAN